MLITQTRWEERERLGWSESTQVPFWAMPVLIALPLWGYVYQGTLEPPHDADDPLALGEVLYGACSRCHGADGEGRGSVPALTDVLETWPDYRDHLLWVRLGSAGWPGDTYGATNESDGSGMPAFASLSDEELAQVVLYERVELGGLDPASDEYAALAALATGEATLDDVGLGDLATAAGIDSAALADG